MLSCLPGRPPRLLTLSMALQGACPGKLPPATGLRGSEITLSLGDRFHIIAIKTHRFFFFFFNAVIP